MAFDENTGEFLWQQTHEKLPAGRATTGPTRRRLVAARRERARLLLSNRGVLWCLDIKGFANGNDGPVTTRS